VLQVEAPCVDAGIRQVACTTGHIRAGIAAFFIVVLMAVPTLSGRASDAGAVSSPNVVKQTNEVRAKNGVAGLKLDPLLSRAAQAKAEDMAARGYFAHQTPDGRTPWDWIEGAGYDFLAAAENLAVGYPTDDGLISAWMESEGHRHNLLNQKYTDVGIGIARGRYKGQETIFVVQMFGKPRALPVRAARSGNAIGVEYPRLAAVPIHATDLRLDPAPLPAVPLEAIGFHLEPAGLAAFPLESTGLRFNLVALAARPQIDGTLLPDMSTGPSLPFDSSIIPFELAHLPSVTSRQDNPLRPVAAAALVRVSRIASILKHAGERTSACPPQCRSSSTCAKLRTLFPCFPSTRFRCEDINSHRRRSHPGPALSPPALCDSGRHGEADHSPHERHPRPPASIQLPAGIGCRRRSGGPD
jgi:hypothetical protein